MFLERAPAHLHLALMLALWTGQRQGDLLRLPWSAYDGTHIRLRQPKGGVRVQIRVGAPLKAALDAAPRRCTIILTSATGKPWTSGGFQQAWRTACKAAGITGFTRAGGQSADARRVKRAAQALMPLLRLMNWSSGSESGL
jgi:integrase